MLFVTYQKRAKNDLSFELDVEGKIIKEDTHCKLLGVTLSNTFSWEEHVKEVLDECSKRLTRMYKVNIILDVMQRKKLVEGSNLSRLKYSIEVISSGSESLTKKLEGMQSQAARFALGSGPEQVVMKN